MLLNKCRKLTDQEESLKPLTCEDNFFLRGKKKRRPAVDQLMLMEQMYNEALEFSVSVPALSHRLLWGVS